MLKRLTVGAYLAALTGVSLLAMGCSLGGWAGWLPWNTSVTSWPRILAAVLREELGG